MNVATWSDNQRAVLSEMGISLLRFRNSESDPVVEAVLEEPVAPEFAEAANGVLELSGNSRALDEVRALKWFRQAQNFASASPIQMTSSHGELQLNLPGDPPLMLAKHRPSTEHKRRLYRAILALRTRQS